MIYIDIDGVLVDFYGTAKKFGIELEINRFGDWKWGEPPYPAPEEFYAVAELQPWFLSLLANLYLNQNSVVFLTKDCVNIKVDFIMDNLCVTECESWRKERFFESADKSAFCENPVDLLIDDCAAECEAWRGKGGMAYLFDLASKTPFEDFLKWWRMEK